MNIYIVENIKATLHGDTFAFIGLCEGIALKNSIGGVPW
jgi:hypothetical protein